MSPPRLAAATVSWPEGAKRPKTRELHNLAGAGALGGAFWGLLFGLLFFVPLLGMAIGAAAGALSGALTMSSTAIVVKLMAERLELESEHGRRVFGVLLFQDLAVIPLLVLIPALGQHAGGSDLSATAAPLGWAALKAVALLLVLLRFGQPVMRGCANTSSPSPATISGTTARKGVARGI